MTIYCICCVRSTLLWDLFELHSYICALCVLSTVCSLVSKAITPLLAMCFLCLPVLALHLLNVGFRAREQSWKSVIVTKTNLLCVWCMCYSLRGDEAARGEDVLPDGCTANCFNAFHQRHKDDHTSNVGHLSYVTRQRARGWWARQRHWFKLVSIVHLLLTSYQLYTTQRIRCLLSLSCEHFPE